MKSKSSSVIVDVIGVLFFFNVISLLGHYVIQIVLFMFGGDITIVDN